MAKSSQSELLVDSKSASSGESILSDSSATMVKKKVKISAATAAAAKKKSKKTTTAKRTGKTRWKKAEHDLVFAYFYDKKKRIDHNKIQASSDYLAELQAKEPLWMIHPVKNFNQNVRRHSIEYLAELDAGGGRRRKAAAADSDDSSDDDLSEDDESEDDDDDAASESSASASTVASASESICSFRLH